MARLIKKSSALEKQYSLIISKIKRIILCAFIFIALGICGSLLLSYNISLYFGLALILVSVGGFITCIILTSFKSTDAAIIKSGIDGENETAQLLKSKLPDGYRVFQNIDVFFDGKKSELDFIVVGNTGVFVVECKNRKGIIKGNYASEKWKQIKSSNKSEGYSFYNPVKQVSTHIFRLKRSLQRKNINVHLNGIVYFPNIETVLKISHESNQNIPVINSQNLLIEHILNTQNCLNETVVNRICTELKKL